MTLIQTSHIFTIMMYTRMKLKMYSVAQVKIGQGVEGHVSLSVRHEAAVTCVSFMYLMPNRIACLLLQLMNYRVNL